MNDSPDTSVRDEKSWEAYMEQATMVGPANDEARRQFDEVWGNDAQEMPVYAFAVKGEETLFFSRKDDTSDAFVSEKLREGVFVRVMAVTPEKYYTSGATLASARFFDGGIVGARQRLEMEETKAEQSVGGKPMNKYLRQGTEKVLALLEDARRADPTPEVRRRIEGEFADRVKARLGEIDSCEYHDDIPWCRCTFGKALEAELGREG